MTWIKRLFKTEEEAPAIKKEDFSIEFYPLTNRHYPMYQGKYLFLNPQTGIMQTQEPFLFMCSDYGNTEVEAIKLINLFKEQQLKENVVVTKLKG